MIVVLNLHNLLVFTSAGCQPYSVKVVAEVGYTGHLYMKLDTLPTQWLAAPIVLVESTEQWGHTLAFKYLHQ
jgi:hypothetical protein